MYAANIDALRNINKLRLFKSVRSGATEPLFEGYTTGGLSYSTGIEQSSMLDIFSKSGVVMKGLGAITSGRGRLLTGALGKVSGLDMSRKFLFSGTKPITMDFDTFLVLENDYNTDIADPINRLVDFVMPSRGEHLNKYLAEFREYTQGFQAKEIEKQKQAGNDRSTGGIYDLMLKGIDWLNDFAGDTYLLNLPQSYQDGAKLTLRWGGDGKQGGYRFDDVIITSISFAIPTLVYEHGLPPYVRVKLHVETTRVATANLCRFTRV